MGGDAEDSLIKPHQPLISSPPHHRGGRGGRNYFPVGSVVEVRTDEEDFRGVFFSATVLPPPNTPKKSRRKKSRKLYVEYHNLLAHDDGSDRLREYVGVSFVRPEPPLQEIVKGFELDDVVDAFNRDGWWTGVVTRVLEGGERYIVTFKYPPDVLELGLAELRVHWDWVNGSWVRPQKQSIAGLMFDVGKKVEVSFGGELRDAWFPATIQEDLGNGDFSVEYKIADTGSQAVKATVDSLHVRPCPPLLKAKNFVLLEKVDAFFDFGWWSGIITKELENSGYVVFFKQSKREKTFNLSELRPHMEWKDGKWFTSSQLSQEASIPSSDDGVHEHHTPESSRASGETAPVDNFADDGKIPSSLTLRKGYLEQLPPDNQKMSHVTTSLRKRRQHLSDSGSALSQPLKKLKEGGVMGANQQDRHDVSVKGVLCDFGSPEFVNNMETSATETTGDQSSCDPSWGKRIRRQRRSVGATQSIRGMIKSTLSSMEKSSTEMLPHERLELVIGGKPPDTAVNVEEDGQNGHAKEETELPIVIGLPCGETGSSEFGRSGGRRSHRFNGKEIAKQQQQLENPTAQQIKESEQSEIGEFSERRKRGRPKRTLVEATQTPVAGDLNRENDGSQKIPEVVTMRMEASISDREKMVVDKKLADGLSEPKTRKVRMLRKTLARVHDEKGVKESVRPGQNPPLRRGRRRSTGEKIAVQAQDFVGASGGKMMEDNRTVEAEKVSGEGPGNEFDDEPLSKWIEEMQSPSVIDGTRLSSVGTMEQCLKNGEEQRDGVVLDEETGRQASALVDQGSIVSSEPQSVPSMENTVGVVPAEGGEKQPESGTPAFASVDKGSVVPSEPESLPSVDNTVGVVLDEDSKKQPESGTQAPALVDEGSIVLCEPPTLPFVKNTFLWKTIESMEVFQRMPQKPHFQPLEHLKESSREGLAIGYMVTFSSLVEKTSKLQLSDPKSIMDDIVESLTELEKHGFNVRVVQDRVTELLAVKENEEKLVDSVSDINNQILERNHEKARIEKEMQDISLCIKQLQEKLSLVESAKDKEEDEIAILQDRLKETEEIIKNVRCDFEGIVSNIL